MTHKFNDCNACKFLGSPLPSPCFFAILISRSKDRLCNMVQECATHIRTRPRPFRRGLSVEMRADQSSLPSPPRPTDAVAAALPVPPQVTGLGSFLPSFLPSFLSYLSLARSQLVKVQMSVRPHPTWFPLTDHSVRVPPSLSCLPARSLTRSLAFLSVYRPGLYVKRAHCEIDDDAPFPLHPSLSLSLFLLPRPREVPPNPRPKVRSPSSTLFLFSPSITKTQMPINCCRCLYRR